MKKNKQYLSKEEFKLIIIHLIEFIIFIILGIEFGIIHYLIYILTEHTLFNYFGMMIMLIVSLGWIIISKFKFYELRKILDKEK